MLLTFDVVASWQFLLPAQSIGQKNPGRLAGGYDG
jgi:hypothetical protein